MPIFPKFSRILALSPFLVLIFSCSGQNQFVGQVEQHPEFVIPVKNNRVGVLPIVKSRWEVLSNCDSCFGLSQNQMEFGFYGDVDSLFRLNGYQVVDSWLLQGKEASIKEMDDSIGLPAWIKGEYLNQRSNLYQKLDGTKSSQVQNLLLEFQLDYIFEPYLVSCQIKGKGRRQGERSCQWNVAIYQNKLIPFVAWIGRYKTTEEFFLEGDIDRRYHHEFITWLESVWRETKTYNEFIEIKEMD
jgi:hypothetical protein